jgi:hypothetical protein
MAGLLFVSQAMLDSWAEGGKIEFAGNVMTLVSGEGKGRSYALDPAVRFLKVLGADADPNGLLHKVKSAAQLRALGAEPVDDSCILGDVAYEVQPGFLAEASALAAASQAPVTAPVTTGGTSARSGSGEQADGRAPARSVPLGEGPLRADLEEKRKEAEALARFLLENLS